MKTTRHGSVDNPDIGSHDSHVENVDRSGSDKMAGAQHRQAGVLKKSAPRGQRKNNSEEPEALTDIPEFIKKTDHPTQRHLLKILKISADVQQKRTAEKPVKSTLKAPHTIPGIDRYPQDALGAVTSAQLPGVAGDNSATRMTHSHGTTHSDTNDTGKTPNTAQRGMNTYQQHETGHQSDGATDGANTYNLENTGSHDQAATAARDVTGQYRPASPSPTPHDVIIDESVYDFYGMHAPDFPDDERDNGTVSGKLLLRYWRATALAVLMVTVLGLTIQYRLGTRTEPPPEGDQTLAAVGGSHSPVGSNTGQDPFAEESDTVTALDATASNPMGDINLPVVTTDASETSPRGKPDPLVSSVAPTVRATAQDADSASRKPPLASKANELDQQLTRILEKTRTNRPETEADAESATHNGSIAKTGQSQTVSPATTSPAAGKKKVPVVARVQRQRATPPVAKTTHIRRTAPTTTAAITAKAAGKTSKPAHTPISRDDLSALLARLSNAYEKGSLPQLVSNFAPDIYDNDGANRQQLEQQYRQLFTITDKRQLKFQNVTWSAQNKQMLGKGDFEVMIREKGATNHTTYAGIIHFVVARESNTIVIKKLDYDYKQ